MTTISGTTSLAASTLIDKLFAARQGQGGSGNRRRLFMQFDGILADASDGGSDQDFEPNFQIVDGVTGFSFRSVFLRNWKAFEQIELAIPAPGQGRPIVLIGGNNGNGKTSLLEAISYGLYGLRGHLDKELGLRTASDAVAGPARRADYYKFIERALHRQSRERGEAVINIRISADTAEGPLEIDRYWYFDDAGRFSEGDEELILRVGDDRHVMQVPEGEHAVDYYQSEIERMLVPASMLPFFMFDGEYVRRLAERELNDQVRFGIETALGLTTLRALVDDLRDYARDRGRDLQAEDLDNASAATSRQLEAELASAIERCEALEVELEKLRERRDGIVLSAGSLGVATYDEQKDSLERRKFLDAQIKTGREALVGFMSKAPFALIGPDLLRDTFHSLDEMRQEQEKSFAFRQDDLEALLAAANTLEPRLDEPFERLLADRVSAAWQALRNSAGCTTSGSSKIYSFLEGRRVDRVLRVLEQAPQAEFAKAHDAFAMIEECNASLAAMGDAEDTRKRTELARAELADQLSDMNAQIAKSEERRRVMHQNRIRVELALEPLRAESQRKRVQRSGAGTLVQRLRFAELAVATILDTIEALIPQYYEKLALSVTEVYRALAHKGIVERITIDTTGSVSLLDAAGRNLRDTDPSAGEGQIFAMSLISAISDLLGSPLPLVVDTPLGRLDPQHRERVLRHFAERPVQTVLLSQPEEVGGRYYDMIANRIIAEFHLSYQPSANGLGRTLLVPGYFPRYAA